MSSSATRLSERKTRTKKNQAEGDLWIIDLSSGDLERFFHKNGFYDRAFSWSPDGTKIAFASARNGDPDIYVMELDIASVKKKLGLSR